MKSACVHASVDAAFALMRIIFRSCMHSFVAKIDCILIGFKGNQLCLECFLIEWNVFCFKGGKAYAGF